MKVGDHYEEEIQISEAAVAAYGQMTGDLNPVHFDDAAARRAGFDGRIAPGMLTASFFSYLLGMKFPGPGTIYLAQSIRFTAPVRMGERLRYRLVVIAQKPDRPIYTLSTEIFGEDGRPRLTGEATIKVSAATDGSTP